MSTLSGLQFYPAQSAVSLPEQNKYSSSQTAKSGVTILPNPPIAKYAEDFQARLEVVSKLHIPHTEVQRAYGEFVKKLNEMCYETVAEQLVQSSRPVSVAGSMHSQNMRPASKRTVKKSDNCSNSTIQRLYKAAEGVQKHLSTISESSHGEGLIRPIKQANGRNRSKVTVGYEKSLRNMDSTMDHFRSNGAPKCQSRKVASTKKIEKEIEESSTEVMETEFNITKDSLRNGTAVARGQKERITSVRTNGFKCRQNEDSVSVISKMKNSRKEIAQEALHEIRSNHKKTALSPFYQRLHKQRRLSPKTTPLFKS